ncbi:MAG: ABC transporter ATP-binding protein/permease [Clostridiales bacterium]|nr:ABC transporter ATP-binding protein/permease [Clostridiales bacterium]
MIKTLLKSLREYKKTSLATIFFAVIEVVFEIVIPIYMSDLIDYGIDEGNVNMVGRYGIMLIVFAVMQLVTGFFDAKFGAKAAAGFAANLRKDMYDNVQTFSFSNIDKFSSSSIVTRLTTDVTNVQNAYQMIIRVAVRSPIMIIFAMSVSFSISAKIAVVFLAVIPLLGICLYLIIRFVHPIFKRVFHTYDELNNIVQENVKGVRVVKSFNSQNYEIGKFRKISKSIYTDFSKAERLIALNAPSMQFFMYGCMILISWIGAKAIVASGNNAAAGLTTGQLTALFTYAIQILMSLMMLSMVFSMITIANSSAERITEILTEETDIKNSDNPVKEVKNGDISYENVDFVYASKADKKVISNASLYIHSGETIGIIGGTGSSKTSFVQLIPRLYDVTGGKLTVGGVDVRDYDLDTLRNAVSFVLQKNELFSGTVKENLRWGNENATDDEIKEACRLACADEFIEAMPQGYDTYIEQGGSNVSGGQKQRLCIARALLKNPKILILDDSTSAVDTKTDSFIQNSFAKFIPQTTKIIIAQRISSVMNSDRIVVMNDGKIESVGTHDELLKSSGLYKEIFESQQKEEE